MEELGFIDDESSEEENTTSDTEAEAGEKLVRSKKSRVKAPLLLIVPKLVPKFTELTVVAMASK